jgi:hypothetical protein
MSQQQYGSIPKRLKHMPQTPTSEGYPLKLPSAPSRSGTTGNRCTARDPNPFEPDAGQITTTTPQ